MNRAIEIAKQRAKIDAKSEVELVVYPQRKSFWSWWQTPFGASAERRHPRCDLLGHPGARARTKLTAPLRLFRRGEPLAIMPNVFVR